ncbi:MAG: phosphatidylethanolamine-binding protein (PEBP) family uncharacterized protein [Gammaproteobacteria bacterium]|jgi:phosphatidylethanolamine-binding protein (PEBP) family uncharacterized protein
MKKSIFLVLPLCTALYSPTQAADFSIAFEWGDIPSCSDGYPNNVKNPRFELMNVPATTQSITFEMNDLDVDYYHGDGVAKYDGKDVIESGVFEYESPCPPGGVHTYEWMAKAMDSAGQVLAQATARRKYPE